VRQDGQIVVVVAWNEDIVLLFVVDVVIPGICVGCGLSEENTTVEFEGGAKLLEDGQNLVQSLEEAD